MVAIADEIYEHIVFDGLPHIPIATFPDMQDRTITICGLGKTFSVTGWRVGYCIASADLTDALRKVHDLYHRVRPHAVAGGDGSGDRFAGFILRVVEDLLRFPPFPQARNP